MSFVLLLYLGSGSSSPNQRRNKKQRPFYQVLLGAIATVTVISYAAFYLYTRRRRRVTIQGIDLIKIKLI